MGSEMDYTYEERQRIVNDGLYQKFFIETPIGDVAFTIGAEAANIIQVDCQIVDPAGDPMPAVYGVDVFLTDDADGKTLTSVLPSGGVVAPAGDILTAPAADSPFLALSDDTGLLSLALTEVGAATWYVAIKLPNGLYAVSEAVTFA